MGLADYRRKRTFKKTPEPSGDISKSNGPLRFVVQKHNASHLHYDFRLELDGVLKSWAIPKGPSMNPDDKRLAVMVEDHPLSYEQFEGIIPKGNYGAGTVMVWDAGVYSPIDSVERKEAEKILREQLKKGHLTFVLLGEKLKGEFALVKTTMQESSWLLVKAGDEYATKADILKMDTSVLTKRTTEEIAAQAENKQEVWHSLPKNFHLDENLKASLPHDIKPMLAGTADEPFDNPDWLFELKLDGYRAIAEIQSGKVKLYSRNKISYNERFAPLVTSLQKFPRDAVLDGEIVVLDDKGHPNFAKLHSYPEKKGTLAYYIFDILYFDGYLLTEMPLIERKKILKAILPSLPNIYYGDYIEEHGNAFFAQVKKLHLEGIMAKKKDSTYKIGNRSDTWLKIKKGKVTEAVIVGFTAPRGGRSHFGALVLGTFKNGKLTHIGNAGSGFTDETLELIHKQLTPLIQDNCSFKNIPETKEKVTWVQPVLTCDVTYSQWTDDGKMRHPIFLGVHDVAKKEKKFATTAPDESNHVEIDGKKVTLTNLTKIFWPTEKYTKADIMYYYGEIANIILPYLKNRPQSLLRFPDGIDGENFFQKDVSMLNASWLSKVKISSDSEKKTTEYLLCQDKASLMYILNLGCIDFNPWNSRVGNLENPDYVILDLDPENAKFEYVIEVAQTARKILEYLDIPSFCKTSGKRGLHIYIPLEAIYSYEQVRQFSQLLALQIQNKLPKLVSLKRNPAERKGKIYIDYLRNGHGQTTASVYSVRAWPEATVSAPLEWNEVTKRLDTSRFTMKTMVKRLDKKGDLFKGVLGKGVKIEKILGKLELMPR